MRTKLINCSICNAWYLTKSRNHCPYCGALPALKGVFYSTPYKMVGKNFLTLVDGLHKNRNLMNQAQKDGVE